MKQNTPTSIKHKVILLGYAGHGVVVGEAAKLSGINVIGYADKKMAEWNGLELEYLGDERSDTFKGWLPDVAFILGIGSNVLREKGTDFIRQKGYSVQCVVHPQAMLSAYTSIGEGTFIGRNACVNPNTSIGTGVIINTGAIVEHDCQVNDYAHIAPGAVLAGNVTVGKGSFVGANSVVREGITIGSNVMIGAGSVVVKDVPDEVKIFGNPASIKSN